MASKEKSSYERIGDRANRGDYTVVYPIDPLILSFLPEQGELFAGLYPLGETVHGILAKFTPEQQKVLDTKMISARLRVMHKQHLCAPTSSGNTTRGKQVWQRTSSGKKLVNKWKAENNGSGNKASS